MFHVDYDFLCLMYGTSGASGKLDFKLLLHIFCITGCLWCLVTLDQLRTSSPTSRLCARRSLETMLADYQRFIASGGDIKNAKYYNNCINEPFFKIPLSQVPCMDTTNVKCILISDLLAGLCSWPTHHSRNIPEALFCV